MNLRSAFRISSLGAASAALSFAIALAVSAASPTPQSATSRDSGVSDTVNRTSKGDRMRVIVRPSQSTPFEVQMPGSANPRAQDGCESGFGWQMDQTSAAKVERCVT
jgi:endonuclease YncB( thermonuclease family)